MLAHTHKLLRLAVGILGGLEGLVPSAKEPDCQGSLWPSWAYQCLCPAASRTPSL